MNIVLLTVLTAPKTEYVEALKDSKTEFLAVHNWRDRNGKEHDQLYIIEIYGKRGANLAPHLNVGRDYMFSGLAIGGSYVSKTGANAGKVVQAIKMRNPSVDFTKGSAKKESSETATEVQEIPEEIAIDPEAGPF